MKEIQEIESILNAAKAVFTNKSVTESYRKKTKDGLKKLLKSAKELI